ncbi:hypothetical protein LCGC14_0093700 [marine sediment metagenome]|uniref:Uncharacterized protein n=1 Tax=marine sediment metagenome TaxID=412755 RepID=A0A0F9VE62_9ZZZZ|nr:tetratricopeptide repeat protein [Phycisphaerae bacterium]HDZ44034.1 tetratricopeptide repeat protein [Phycisphaerae bacterium]
MKRIFLPLALLALTAVVVGIVVKWQEHRIEDTPPGDRQPVLAVKANAPSTVDAGQQQLILALAEAGRGADSPGEIVIDYPIDGSIFPPDMIAPTFLWHDDTPDVDRWLINVALADGEGHIYVLAEGDPPPMGETDPRCFGPTNEPYEPTPYQASAKSWTPDADVWEAIKAQSAEAPASVIMYGFNSDRPSHVLSTGQMTMTTSRDPVDAPIFYRDVPLMPVRSDEDGVIKPLADANLGLIQWRLKDVSRPDSRVVLADIPTCANCHSFSADGQTLGMDVDGPSGDKGAYALAQIERDMSIGPDEIITWNSFADKPEGHRTIGFLSRVSPDGQHVISTVNEAVYVANFTDHEFLQVFYPTRGILAYYSRRTDEMKALPGADDTDYVHCDPVWTPDGETVVFARARACDPYSDEKPTHANDERELQIQFDLFRIPFKDGLGGEPEPIEGASNNGMSNTFPKVSPDGKWIVFVKCRNGQLMRPDGELWIVPVEGGQARKMACNTRLMNSWHSFSPNGRWMVFSSKSNTPYTQMLLTHIDADGNDSPAILIPNATAANRAVNIPEFVNINYDELVSMEVPGVAYYQNFNRGNKLMAAGRLHEAIAEFNKALGAEPTSVRINTQLGTCFTKVRQLGQASACFERVVQTDPKNTIALINLGALYVSRGMPAKAIRYLEDALKIDPDVTDAHINLGIALDMCGDPQEAFKHFQEASTLSPDSAKAHNGLGLTSGKMGRTDEAIEHFQKALLIDPQFHIARRNLRKALQAKTMNQGS